MKGLELSRKFYEHCRPILLNEIPDVMQFATCGLAGEGSECFGLDDDISKDHDFGPAFCIWLPDELLDEKEAEIEKAMTKLPVEFAGHASKMPRANRGGRVGPIGIRAYYAFFTGLDNPPASWRQWLYLKETALAPAVNGEIFDEGANEFANWRQALLDFYPRDVWLKKIAARVMAMAQAGQYNLPRLLLRKDKPAALLASAKFAEAALSLVFLLNRKYMPYYKLAPRLARALPVLGERLGELLDIMAERSLSDAHNKETLELVEDFCGACAAHLRAIGLSDERDSWLWIHGPKIMEHVQTPEILRMNILEN